MSTHREHREMLTRLEESRAQAKVMMAFADGSPVLFRPKDRPYMQWTPCIPTWDWVRADYQIDPNPRVDWPSLPAWANYVARDSNGRWWWCESRPSPEHDGWRYGDGSIGTIPKQFEPQYAGDLPWDKLVIERPSK